MDERQEVAGAAARFVLNDRGAVVRAATAISLMLLTAAALWPATLSLAERWNDTVYRTYTHGWLIAAIVLWLLWRERSRMGIPKPFLPGVLLLVGFGLIWLIAFRAGLQIVYQGLLPIIAASALLTCFGWRAARSMAFAVAYAYLAIPVFDALLPLLQWLSVFAVRFMLRITSIPAYFESNTFALPSGTFEIADGCSGLHFFIVALSLSLLHGEINRDRLGMRIRLVAFALVLAVLTNWLRIYILVVVGHLSEMQHYLVATEHYSFGWYLFAGVMTIYFLVTRRWPLSADTVEAHETAKAPAAAMPVLGVSLAAIGVLLPSLLLLGDANQASAQSLQSLQPRTPAGWQAAELESVDWRPKFAAADQERFMEFRSDTAVVQTYTALYAQQRQGKEVVGYGNSPLGEGWRVLAATPSVAPPAWTELQIEGTSGERWLLWYANRLDERWYASPLRMQLDYGLRSIAGAPAAGALLVRVRCMADECAAARESLRRFAAASWN